MKKALLVIMGSELAEQGVALGNETKVRCDRAIKKYGKLTKSGYSCSFLTSPGISKERWPKQTKSMAELMKDYLCQKGIEAAKIHVSDDLTVWGSRAEIAEVEKVVKFDNPKVFVVSSWYHIPRLMLVCYKRSRKIRWRFVPGKGSPKKALWELLKFPGELLNVKRRLT